jgi:hypothetical protein
VTWAKDQRDSRNRLTYSTEIWNPLRNAALCAGAVKEALPIAYGMKVSYWVTPFTKTGS